VTLQLPTSYKLDSVTNKYIQPKRNLSGKLAFVIKFHLHLAKDEHTWIYACAFLTYNNYKFGLSSLSHISFAAATINMLHIQCEIFIKITTK